MVPNRTMEQDEMTYTNAIMGEVTQLIKNRCNKQACSDLRKGKKIRSPHTSAKWAHIFKLYDYQCRALTGKRQKKVKL